MDGGPQSERNYTLEQVARLAGVSTATVARTIKTPEKVAEPTRRRVRQVLAETSYMPDPLAMGLASKRTNLVMILVPGAISPIFTETIFGISRELAKIGFLAVTCVAPSSEDEMSRFTRAIILRRPDALILVGSSLPANFAAKVREAKVTVIETWALWAEPVDIAIGFSQEAAGRAVAQLLFERGLRKPLAITTDRGLAGGGERALGAAGDRARGLAQGCRALGMAEPMVETIPLNHGFQNGRLALARRLDAGDRPDAVVCSSDLVAHGVLTEAMARGLRVPADIAVIGFGGADFASATIPSLTTVHIDGEAIARQTAEVVFSRSRGEPLQCHRIDVGFRVIVRESV